MLIQNSKDIMSVKIFKRFKISIIVAPYFILIVFQIKRADFLKGHNNLKSYSTRFSSTLGVFFILRRMCLFKRVGLINLIIMVVDFGFDFKIIRW